MGEKTFVIEGQKEDEEVSERVISEFNMLTNNLSGVYGFYVIDLKNGFAYGVNQRENFEPASLNKLPVILGLYMESDAGNLDLNAKYTLKNSDKLAGSGTLYSKPAGMVLTYRDLIRYMGKESDNTAYNIARRILGQEKIESVIRAVGMENTVVSGNDQKTTPEDIGTFFRRLYLGGLITDSSKVEFLGFLTDTIYEDYLAAGVPDGVKVAHKFGRELHILNDAGIVYSENSYVIVIMSKGIVEKEADQFIPQFAKIVYNSFQENPTLQSGDELNSDMSSSLRGNSAL
jgi:beta-lactamase class A